MILWYPSRDEEDLYLLFFSTNGNTNVRYYIETTEKKTRVLTERMALDKDLEPQQLASLSWSPSAETTDSGESDVSHR